MEMENSVDKSKKQVDKQNSSQRNIENEVPDKKSKPVVKFNLDMHEDSDIDFAKKHNNLDLDALELTNKIFSTTNNDTNEVKEVAPKTRDIPNKVQHKPTSQTKILGDLDKEAIKLTNVIFSNTNDTTDTEDIEAFTNASNKPISKPKGPLKSIMKNTSMKSKANIDGEKIDIDVTNNINLNKEKESELLKQKSESNTEKVEENPVPHTNGVKSSILDTNVSINGSRDKEGSSKKTLSHEKTTGKDVHVNGTRESAIKPSPDMKGKKENIIADQSLNKKNQNENVPHTNGIQEASTKSKIDTKTNKSEEPSSKNDSHANEKILGHKSWNPPKNISVNTASTNSKNEVNKLDNLNQQNSKGEKVVKTVPDTNNSKKATINNSGGSLSSTNNQRDNSCADQIYKQKQPGPELSESHQGKIKESLTPTVNTSSQSSSKIVPNNAEIKHAQQCFVVNQPLSPATNRKDIGRKTSNPQIDGPGLGSENVLDKKQGDKNQITSQPKISNMNSVNSEPKKVVVFTQIPNDTKTKGENTTFLEQSGRSDMTQKVKNNSSVSDKIFKQPQANGLSLVPQALQQSYTAKDGKSNLDKDLEKLDKQHAVKMQKIVEKSEEAPKEKKLDLSNNTEVHTKRPSLLGPSRFDNPSGTSTGLLKENVPKRNDTVYNFNTDSLPKSGGTVTFEKPSTSSSYQISKSSTTVLDTRKKSPEDYMKKFDRNFNVSPEPFFVSKSKSNVYLSDQPSNKYQKEESRNPLTISSTYDSTSKSSYNLSSSSKTTSSNTKDYSRPSDSISMKSQSPGNKAYSSTQTLSSSKSYTPSTTFPSISSLPTPASLSTYSGPYSSPATNSSASSYPSPSIDKKYTPSTFASPSNFTPSAKSSNLENRVKSDGSTLLTKSSGTMQNNYSLSSSSSKASTDLYLQIQATKDKHKSDLDRAMDFDKTNWKPPVIKEKLPRPDPTPIKYSMTLGRDKTARRNDRERTVIDGLMKDRASRGKSDDFLKTSSYRL